MSTRIFLLIIACVLWTAASYSQTIQDSLVGYVWHNYTHLEDISTGPPITRAGHPDARLRIVSLVADGERELFVERLEPQSEGSNGKTTFSKISAIEWLDYSFFLGIDNPRDTSAVIEFKGWLTNRKFLMRVDFSLFQVEFGLRALRVVRVYRVDANGREIEAITD